VIRFNHIFSNDHLGIDHLLPTGTTDAPTLDSVTTNGTSITVTGSVNHGLSGLTTDIVDVYVGDACDGSAGGEGQNFVGTFNKTSSNVPDRGFIQTLNVPLAVGAVVTLTQTSADHGSDGTTQFSQCESVTTNSQTGTFALTPRLTTTSVKTPLRAGVVWTVPAPHVWRNLASIDVRLTTETGQNAFEIHWDEAANTFNLVGKSDAVAPGSNRQFESEWVSLDLATASVVGSGPTGPSVTLTLPFTFKEHAAGHTFTVAIKGADDFGHQDEYLNNGTWQVTPRYD